MKNTSVLIADGDKRICNLIKITLTAHDYKATTVNSGENAIFLTYSVNPDIVILDVSLPDMDGTEVIRRIRSCSDVPIVVISARDEDQDKVMAFDAGADDYLTKPFSIEELLARLRVIERRYVYGLKEQNAPAVFENGSMKIDYAAGCVYVKTTLLHLTPIEYRLLCMLAHNVGKVLTLTYLTKNIWGTSWDSNIMTLRTFMASLRKKLAAADSGTDYICTHTKIGYRMPNISSESGGVQNNQKI